MIPSRAAAAVLVCACAALAPRVRAETLADAVALAYATNPTVQAQRASQRALDETYVQAQAGYRPTLNAQGAVTADNNGFPVFGLPNAPTSPGRSQSSNAVITLSQPLYTGGRVSAQVDAALASVLAGRAQLLATEQNLLQAVIGAYADVRRDQQAVAIAQEDLTLLDRQLSENRERFAAGEITRTDVAQTEERAAAARSAVAAAMAQLGVSRAGYDSVVGQNPGDLAPEPSLAQALPPSLDEAFAAAETDSPQVQQARLTERASAARVAEARAQTRPSVSLQGSFGYYAGSAPNGSPFANPAHDLSASAVATLPIFTGGLTQSQIRQAAETNTVDVIGIEGARRQVMLTVARTWNQLLGARAALSSDETRVTAANIAFEGSREEFKAGLRSTLDVLISEQDLGAAQIALVGARHDEYVAAAQLLAAIGRLRVVDLSPGAAPYDPKRNFDRVKHAPGWVPWQPVVSGLDHIGAPR